jgi:hypothetical protein
MRFNSGSSIKNNAYSSSSASSNTNEKLKKLNEELDQLELLVSSMQSSISSANSKIGTDTVADQIAAAKTEIENAIGQEVTTQKVSASRANIEALSSATIRTNDIGALEADSLNVSTEVKVPSIKLSNAASVSKNNDVKVPDGAIAWIGHSIVVNKGNGNALIFSKTGDVSYHFVDDDLFIYLNNEVRLTYIYADAPVEVIPHQDYDYTSANSGLTVIGPFYADLTKANFQNITISNTLTAKDITAENIAVSEDVNVDGTVAADKVESNDAEIKEIESETITSDRLNSSQIHTKIDKENIGYTTIQEHQDTEEYTIGIPITSGLWEIELEGYIKATIDKTNSAVLITYWRESESALTRVGVKDGIFYFYTRKSGKLYFSNNTLEVNDTTVSINAPNDPGYPIPETLDKEINITTNEGVIATETMVVDNLIVTGDLTIKDFVADKVAVRITDEDQDFNVTFTAPLPDPEEEETSNNYIYGDSNLTYNPNTNTLGTGSIKVEKSIELADSVDEETEEMTYSSGEEYQYLSVSCEADGETLRAHWEDAADTISCTNPNLTSSQTIAAYNGKTVENEYPITHLGDCTCVHGNANVECKLTTHDAQVSCTFKSPHIGDGQTVTKGLQFEDNIVRAVGWCDKWYTYCTDIKGDVFCVREIPENAILNIDQYHCRTYRTRPTGDPKYEACQFSYFASSDSKTYCTVGFRPSHNSSTTSYVEFLRVKADGCICEFTAGSVLASPDSCKFITCGEMCMPGDLPNVGSIRVCAANITRRTRFYRKDGDTCCEVAVFGSVCDGQLAVYNGTTNAFDTASCINLDELNVCHLEAGEASISGDLCANTVTANCFCGKATCADIADVACTVCVNGVTGTRPILTLGSDGKIYNTGDNVLAGSRCIITPILQTSYIFPTPDCNTIELYNGIGNDDSTGYDKLVHLCYTPYRCLYDQYDCTYQSRICFENILGGTNGTSINGTFSSDCDCTYSYFSLNKNVTCYHRSDPVNKICSKMLTSCAGHIFLDTCKWNYGENIDGQGCLSLGICSNILYSKSCINGQYNRLVQDCAGTCICSCRSSSTYCPTTLQVCFNGIKTNAKNNIAESYLSEKPNSFILHTCDTANCKTGSIEVDSDSGYILHCTCNGNCGRVDFSQNGVTFIQNNVSSTIIGDQFSGNAATATNADIADNSTCFNNCTYSEACADIRNGLATQACADAIQNCADFIQSCVTAIESKIPAQASASNQLADKDFVNSSITTNTANFRGTYACVAELPSTGNTNNDYAFVCSLNTTTGNYVYDRYKWVASNSCWVCEYEINTTGFTAEQLASINSGITDTLVAKITDVYDNTVTVCMNDECKGSFSLNQNTDVCIDLGNTIKNACCAKTVCRNQATTGTYNLALTSGNTAIADANVYVSSACPIIYCPATGFLCTRSIRGGNGLTAGSPVGCTSTVTGQAGTWVSLGTLDLYTTLPSINLHACYSSVITHTIDGMPGTLRLLVNNGKGCKAATECGCFCFCSNGILYANCFSGTADTAISACSANNATNATNATNAENSTCFNGYEYAYAKDDIRSGLTSCTGTVTSVNVSVNGCSGTAVTSSGTITLTGVKGAGTCVYNAYCIDWFCGSADRPLVLANAPAPNLTPYTTSLGVTTCSCPQLTYNPATGVLCATCIKGSTSVIAGNPTACTSTQAGSSGSTVDSGSIELYHPTPFIDFHQNNACADYSHRIIANNGYLRVTATNATGCTPDTQHFNFDFCSNGIFRSDRLWTECIETGDIKASGALWLGAECDICIYDTCGHNFLCGYCNNLTIGYKSNDFVDDSSECCRITVGLDNHMCVSGNDCGNSVVVGLQNSVCWDDNDLLNLIFGFYNKTCNGGLAVGGWNKAYCDCSVALGWDNTVCDYGTAIGIGSFADSGTIAIGCDANAGGGESIAIGYETHSEGYETIAIGYQACACGPFGLAIGYSSTTNAYGTACVNSSIRKGPLREITVTWCDSTLKCDIWKAIACNLDLRKNGKGTALTSGCTYLSATGYIGNNSIPIYTCNYNYNSSLASMCCIVVRDNNTDDIMTISATCTAAASTAEGGGFLTITGWAR